MSWKGAGCKGAHTGSGTRCLLVTVKAEEGKGATARFALRKGVKNVGTVLANWDVVG